MSNYKNINIDTYEGEIPRGHDLTVYEKGTNPSDTGCVLYGFDEVGLYDDEGELMAISRISKPIPKSTEIPMRFFVRMDY